MAKYIYKGHAITGGSGDGTALKTNSFKPICAVGKKEIKSALSASWINADPNSDIGTTILTDKVLFLKDIATDGYSEAILNKAVQTGKSPLALLFSGKVSDRIADMAIFTFLSAEKGIIVVDELGEKIVDFVNNGDKIIIKEDGTVIVEKITALSV